MDEALPGEDETARQPLRLGSVRNGVTENQGPDCENGASADAILASLFRPDWRNRSARPVTAAMQLKVEAKLARAEHQLPIVPCCSFSKCRALQE